MTNTNRFLLFLLLLFFQSNIKKIYLNSLGHFIFQCLYFVFYSTSGLEGIKSLGTRQPIREGNDNCKVASVCFFQILYSLSSSACLMKHS